ncbi:hypothetical protein ACFQU9_14855 [Actinomadura namibiensis]|uniref:DUF3558 domain-containing protein n=1 Tax=Actinomadura namibiensis TaxID=182080 RepID=A0A7W3QS27_ACTNM|nr:hypothetical protein [Actinomadura namibiensis]MBA8957389.1 hypothetical protein [Actinomadura namibiensis]
MRASVMVTAACVALTACGVLSNSVTVKEAQPEARKLGITWQPRRAVNPARWPDACDLLGEKEIKAFLPQATNLRRTAEWVTVGEAGALGPDGAGRADSGKCTYEVKLPSPSGRPFGNDISIGIDAVGDPALVTRFFDGARKGASRSAVVEDLNAAGADACFGSRTAKNDVPAVTCRRGPLMFTIPSMSWYVNIDGVEREDTPRKNRVIEKQVIPAVIETVTAKV